MGSIKHFEDDDENAKDTSIDDDIKEFELSDREDGDDINDDSSDDDLDLRDLEIQELELETLTVSPAVDDNVEEGLLPKGEASGAAQDETRTPAKFYGRIRVIRVFGVECYIGPHWLFSIGLLSIMGLITFVFYRLVLPGLPWFHGPVGTALIILSYMSFLKLLISNPGVLGKGSNEMSKPFEGTEQLFPSSGSLECAICEVTQPSGSLHCEYCNVCIDGYDHHCPWTSKCIGKENLCLFYLFLVLNFGTFFYIIVFAFTSTNGRLFNRFH